jgi:hypothetical protein
MTTWFSGERSNSKRSNHAAMVPDRVGKEEAARRIGARPVSTKQHQKTYPEPSTGSDSVKYMQEIDAWFDALFKRGKSETDFEYWKRTRNGVKSKLVESFRNGKKSLAA